ncbi:MAG TPA: hypothetical protein VF522_19045 [Ramlibacter sp.]|uniref:hypothetical protein n=1 Tax=Ramlibacter sp. TaxID=1917967 RepID=UPI002ED1B5EB
MKSGYDRIGTTVTVEHAKRSCLDKVRYDSRNAARDRAVLLAKKYPNTGKQCPYRCTLCGDFHLTTKIPNGLKQGKPNRAVGRQKIIAPQYGRLPKEG